jgi:hypothetical protein
MWIRPKSQVTISAVYVPLAKTASGANGTPLATILTEADVVVATGTAGSVVALDPTKAIRLPISATLNAGVVYKVRLSSISDLVVGVNSLPMNRTTYIGSEFEYLGMGTSVYDSTQIPSLALEV